MKRIIFRLLIIILVLFVPGLAVVFGQPIVTIGSDSILPGGTSLIDITLSQSNQGDPVPPDGFSLTLGFNQAGLSASDPTSTLPFFSIIGGSSSNNSTGRAGVFYDNPGTPLGDVILASVLFEGLAPGSYPLTFINANFVGEVDADTGDFEVIPVDLVDGSITVVPIPSTILLLGGGLVALVGLRRRRRSS